MEVKYDKIGADYNLTRMADHFLTGKLLQHLNPKSDGLYLDIGCGTGNYTNALSKNGFQFIGIDPSETMLAKAKLKNSDIAWKIGSAENTLLPQNHVDGIIGSLTIHHWSNLKNGFLELNRVLKPEGKMVIFTSTPKQMKGYWLNHYFPKMLSASILQMPSLEVVTTAMKEAGFTQIVKDKYFVRPDLQDHFLYCGKHNPELYFDNHIRQGISSFSLLANKLEVENGLSALRKDIDDGSIQQVIKGYDNNLGDYLYIIGTKSTINNGLL